MKQCFYAACVCDVDVPLTDGDGYWWPAYMWDLEKYTMEKWYGYRESFSRELEWP